MKKYIYRLLLSWLSIGMAISARSQHLITGHIEDEKNERMEFVEVLLLTADSSFISGVVSDSMGYFAIHDVAPGNYLLMMQNFGAQLWRDRVAMTASDLDIGLIQVNSATELDEVVVTGHRPIYQRQIDRLVFNVDHLKASTGRDGLEIMKLVPRLKVERDGLTLVGKNALRLMVDDRMMNLSGSEILEYLKGLQADQIKSIEVITNPPAKYAAEGNSGILNVKLKETRADSWNATLKSTYRQNTYPLGYIGGTFNMNKNKLSLLSSVSYYKGSSAPVEELLIHYPNETWVETNNSRSNLDYLGYRIGLEYKASDRWSYGVIYNGSMSRPETSEHNTLFVYNALGELTSASSLLTTASNDDRSNFNNFNGHFTYGLDANGGKLLFDFDGLIQDQTKNRSYVSERLTDGTSNQGFNRGDRHIESYSANIELTHQIGSYQVDYGARAAQSMTNNSFLSRESSSSDSFDDANIQENEFTFEENIGALYFNINKDLSEKIHAQLGLRYETTNTNSFSHVLDQSYDNSYNQLFPTAYISWTPNEVHDLSLNYGRRINRPRFSWLDPFRYYTSAISYLEGNQFLRPAYNHNVELNYEYNGSISFQLYYSDLSDGAEQVTFLDPGNQNAFYTRPVNYIESNTIGANLSFSFDLLDWWSTSFDLDYNYLDATSTIPETNPGLSGSNFYGFVSNSLTFADKYDLYFDVTYFSAGVDGLDESSASAYANVAFSTSLFEDRMDLAISVDDIFRSNKPVYTSYTNGNKIEYKNYYDDQRLRVSLIWKFGNNDLPSGSGRDRKNAEEARRAN